MMCQEFVTEINTLLDMQKSSLPNATRYSYAISQQVDLETQQIDTFAGCVSLEAEKDPRQTCIDIMTEPGHFTLYSNKAKADVCTTAFATWEDVKLGSEGFGGKEQDACAILTSHIFQAYSWYV